MKKYQIENKKKFILSISITILCVIIVTVTLYVIGKGRNTQTTSGEELAASNEETTEEVGEFANLQDLESAKNKTEEELQKINKKEIEKNKTNQTASKNTNKTRTASKNKYYIKVNYGAQVVNVYTYDEKGKYTVPVKAFVCSTGIETPTSGVYKIPAKIKWCYMYGNVYAQYCTQIVGDILFHSVPYLKRRNDTLEYWAYDKLGTKDSLGCVRLTTRDAKWIFDNIPYGTQIEFYSSSNPGPLGKPTAQKISNAPENLRNWDPTDPDPKNPWRTYKPKQEENEKKNTGNNNTLNEIDNTTKDNKDNNLNNEQENMKNNEVQRNNVNEEQKNETIVNNENSNNELINNNVENNESENNNLKNNQVTNTQV